MSDPPVIVYTPDSSLASPWRMIRTMFRDLVASRSLAWRLAVRDLSAQYRANLSRRSLGPDHPLGKYGGLDIS